MTKTKETLRQRIREMLRGWDHLQLSQFSIDWIQGFDDEFQPGVDDHAIRYDLDAICEVLRDGVDKDFFTMLLTFSRLFIKK